MIYIRNMSYNIHILNVLFYTKTFWVIGQLILLLDSHKTAAWEKGFFFLNLSDDPSQIKIYTSKHIQRRQFLRGRMSIET